MINSRFTVALHVLCLLAYEPAEPLTSAYIAGSVNTNPVVIRRILAVLRRAGLVTSRPGVAGGWELAAKPSAITLAHVYRLLGPGTVFAMHSKRPNPRCRVGKGIQRGLLTHYREAQTALEDALAARTVADVLREVLSAGK